MLMITENIDSFLSYYQMVKFYADNTLAGRTFIRNKTQKFREANQKTGADIQTLSKHSAGCLMKSREKERQ